jgi:hypothetical protein
VGGTSEREKEERMLGDSLWDYILTSLERMIFLFSCFL